MFFWRLYGVSCCRHLEPSAQLIEKYPTIYKFQNCKFCKRPCNLWLQTASGALRLDKCWLPSYSFKTDELGIPRPVQGDIITKAIGDSSMSLVYTFVTCYNLYRSVHVNVLSQKKMVALLHLEIKIKTADAAICLLRKGKRWQPLVSVSSAGCARVPKRHATYCYEDVIGEGNNPTSH